MSDTDTNHGNNNIGDKHSYDTVFKEIEEKKKNCYGKWLRYNLKI